MDAVITLLVLSILPQLVVPEAPPASPFRAVVEVVSGDSRIFSGESVRLRCSIPHDHRSTWTFQWFRGSELVSQNMETLTLWRASVRESGKFYCQGVRDTVVGNIYTLQSLPVEINIDGGWAILQVLPRLALVGDTLTMMCRVRANPQLKEVILYRDGVEVMRQNGLNPRFNLTNLTLKDKGLYYCRASWDIDRRTRSVISADIEVKVSEILTQPALEIVADDNLIPVNMMKLICHHQYNARAPAPPVNYYFYKNNQRLGTATSENHDLVKRTPGQYSCKVKVPELGIAKMSEPKSFGQETGPETMSPTLHPRDPWTLALPIPATDSSLLPAAEPTATWPTSQQSSATPTFIQPTEEHSQSSNPTLKPSQPAPSSLITTVHRITQTPELVDIYKESGDMSGDFPDTVLQ